MAEPADPTLVKISNVVATCLFNCPIDLLKLAWATSGDYSPASFAAVQIRLSQPDSTALVFHSGRMVTTGASSESAALMSIYVLFRMIRATHPRVVIKQIAIQNIVSAAAFGKCVQLDRLAKKFALDAIFDASLFPGLRLQLKEPAVKVLVFSRGRVVITGARTRQQVAHAWATVRILCEPFLTADDVSHKSLQIAKNSRKKLKISEDEVISDQIANASILPDINKALAGGIL
jgi:transcription initiation factor TFIID TATA-box-binding protein